MIGRVACRSSPITVPLILAVILFFPATLGGKVLSASDIPLFSAPHTSPKGESGPMNGLQSDSANQFEPDGLLVRQALRDGRLPVWSSSISAGRPLLAEQQSAPLFPLTWIDVVFPYWGSLVWIAVLKLVLAALGTFLLARALGLRRGPALLGAITFAFGTYLIVWLMHPHSNIYIVMPWLFLLGRRLCRTRAIVDTAALGVAFGLVDLGGQPESAFLVSLATGTWIVYELLSAQLPRRDLVRGFALAAGAAVLGFAIGAVMLVPFAEALRQSYATSRATPALPVKSLLSVLFPEFWGRPDRAGISAGPSNFAERTLYVGVLPTLLAVAGLTVRRPRGPQLFFCLLAVGSIVLAVSNPIGTLLRDIPGLHEIDANRALIIASFSIAMLAAFGCEQLLDANVAERKRMLLVAIATALLPAIAVFVAHPSRLGDVRLGLSHLVKGGALLSADATASASVIRWFVFAIASVGLLAALARWRAHAPALVAVCIALVGLDLLVMDAGYSPAIPKAQASPPVPPAVTVMRRLTNAGGRVIGIDAMQPNNASRWGLRDARGSGPPVVARTQRLWFALGGTIESGTPGVAPQDPGTARLLDLFGVKAILMPASTRQELRAELAPPLRNDPIAYSGPGGVVIRNPAALPLAFVAYRWQRSPGLDASLLLSAVRTAQQLRDDPVIETDAAPHSAAGGRATPATLVSQSDTSVTFDVDALGPGRVVFLNTYYPGWHAQVDGRGTSIEPADAAFDAVAVGAGRHRVHFYYRPTSVIVGGVISLLALMLAATVVLWTRLRNVALRRGSEA